MQIGLYSFGDLTPDPHTGKLLSPRERLGEMLAAARLADQSGFEAYAVGEHHRLDFAVSATTIVLAAIAAQTERIKVGSAVTILGTADPVRVFEEYATIDLLSGGRAEIVAGRGIFTESFPLFGHKLEDQDAEFAEKLELLLKLNASPRISWRGRFRPPIENSEISPRPERPLTIWVGTGGTPESAARAGRLGLPLSLGNITLPPTQIAPVVEIYRKAGAEAGHAARLRVAIAKHLYVAKDSQAAREEFFPHYAAYFRSHTPSRYKSMEVSRATFDERAAPDGALYVGSPQELVDKIGRERELFGHERLMAQLDIGGLPYAKVAAAIELLATAVMPKVR